MPIDPLKNKKLPRIKKEKPMTEAALRDAIAQNSSLSKGDTLSAMRELQTIITTALQEGRSVRTSFGTFSVSVRLDGHFKINFVPKREFINDVSGGFKGEILNRKNIGKDYSSL